MTNSPTFDRILGIDPGITGGLAWVSWDGGQRLVMDAPRAKIRLSTNRGYDTARMRDMIAETTRGQRCTCAIELVHSKPGDGHVGSFSFAYGFAIWQGVLLAYNVPIVFVDPRRWQREMGMEPTRDRRQRKHNSRAAAVKFAPELAEMFRRVKDDGRAEALIMAEWLRRKMVMDHYHSTFDLTTPPPHVGEDASEFKGKGGWVFKMREQMKKAGGELF